MNFSKRALVIWGIVGPAIAFFLGPGFIWEYRKSNIETARLDIDRARASLEIRDKMNATLQEIIKLDPNSPLRKRKIDDLNAAENNLARIEERKPVIYDFKPPHITLS